MKEENWGQGDEIAFTAPKTTLPNMHLRKIKPDDFTATEQVLRVVMEILG